MSIKQRLPYIVAQLGTIYLIYWLWQNVDENQATFLSRPSAIWDATWNWFKTPVLRGYIPTTLEEAGLGIVLALALAILFASLLASSRTVAQIFYPIVGMANALPKIAMAPLFLLLFGLGMNGKVEFIAISTAFFPFYQLFAALTSIDPTILANAKMLGASRIQLVREIYIPAIVGASAVSLRLSVAFSLVGAIFAEFIASNAGIGYQILTAQNNQQPDYEMAGIFMIGIIALILDRITVLIQRRFSTWQV